MNQKERETLEWLKKMVRIKGNIKKIVDRVRGLPDEEVFDYYKEEDIPKEISFYNGKYKYCLYWKGWGSYEFDREDIFAEWWVEDNPREVSKNTFLRNLRKVEKMHKTGV